MSGGITSYYHSFSKKINGASRCVITPCVNTSLFSLLLPESWGRVSSHDFVRSRRIHRMSVGAIMSKKKPVTPVVDQTPVETSSMGVVHDERRAVDHTPHSTAAASPNGKTKKTVCPVSRAQFNSGAKGVIVTIGGQQMVAEPKVFSSGSFGWFVQGSVTLQIDGVPVKTQVGLNLVVANSKDLPK